MRIISEYSAIFAVTAASLASPLAGQLPGVSLDASAGGTSSAQRAAVGVWRPIVNPGGRVRLGVGVRLSAFAGDPVAYTNRGPVPGILPFTVTIDPAVYSLNAAVFGEVTLTGAVAVGANLDLAGIATGPTRTVGSLQAEPQQGSYFQNGSGDHGALNSEFFLALRIAPRLRVRAGLSHYVTDYTITDTGVAGSPSSRYQRFQSVPFVAMAVRL